MAASIWVRFRRSKIFISLYAEYYAIEVDVDCRFGMRLCMLESDTQYVTTVPFGTG